MGLRAMFSVAWQKIGFTENSGTLSWNNHTNIYIYIQILCYLYIRTVYCHHLPCNISSYNHILTSFAKAQHHIVNIYQIAVSIVWLLLAKVSTGNSPSSTSRFGSLPTLDLKAEGDSICLGRITLLLSILGTGLFEARSLSTWWHLGRTLETGLTSFQKNLYRQKSSSFVLLCIYKRIVYI